MINLFIIFLSIDLDLKLPPQHHNDRKNAHFHRCKWLNTEIFIESSSHLVTLFGDIFITNKWGDTNVRHLLKCPYDGFQVSWACSIKLFKLLPRFFGGNSVEKIVSAVKWACKVILVIVQRLLSPKMKKVSFNGKSSLETNYSKVCIFTAHKNVVTSVEDFFQLKTFGRYWIM